MDFGGKNTQDQDLVRVWAAPTAGPEISTVLEGILGRWGGLWLPARERTLTAVTQEKHLLFLCFDLFCRFFWTFFFFFLSPTSVVVVNFIGTMKSNLTFELLFFSVTYFVVVINLCLYVGLLQFWGGLFFPLFFNYNFLNLLLFFSTFIPLFAFSTVLSPLHFIFNVYKSSSSNSI